MRIATAAALLALCAAPLAHATGVVVGTSIGNSFARTCYIAAQRGNNLIRDDVTCTTALDQEPLSLRDRAATLINRGVVRTGLRLYGAALEDYEEAIAAGDHLGAGDLGVAYVDRAAVLNQVGRYHEARESANKGLLLGASNPEIGYYARAVSEEKMGDLRAAYYDYKQALSLQPGFTLAAQQLTRFRVETGPAKGS
jgi:tetratricopeptide (TPR) repeat protein